MIDGGKEEMWNETRQDCEHAFMIYDFSRDHI